MGNDIRAGMRQRPKTGNSNMAAQTGNTCISGTAIDSVKIPTVMLGYRPSRVKGKCSEITTATTDNRK